jgi:hypothetical protein
MRCVCVLRRHFLSLSWISRPPPLLSLSWTVFVDFTPIRLDDIQTKPTQRNQTKSNQTKL